MKRLLLPLIILTSALSTLPAVAFRSNAIGQKLEAIEALSGSGYEISEEDGLSEFYQDGVLLRSTSRSGNTETITEGDTITVRTYSDNGLLLEENVTDSNGSVMDVYEYSDNGVLHRVIESRDGSQVSATVYSYSDTSLLARITVITAEESVSYISASSYQYMEDGSPVRVTAYPGVLVRDEADSAHEGEFEENGNLVLSEKVGEDTLVTVYSAAGDRLSETVTAADGTVTSSVTYEYSEGGVLRRMVRESGSARNESYYDENGRLYELRSYSDGVIQRERRYHSDGTSAETRYRNGTAYAVVRYGADSFMVTGVEML